MVARAVKFIRETGQRLTIVTPSSANKAVALRDAVLRAITHGLVGPNELNIVSVVPAGSLHKLRASELSADPDLRRRNPVCVYHGDAPAAVKEISHSAVANYRGKIESVAKTNLWYTLKLMNYLSADVVRAFAENDHFPVRDGRTWLLAHSVSSAYGLLGHAQGRELLGNAAGSMGPGYLLVQHLGAPDMVAAVYRDLPGGFGTTPEYTYDSARSLYRQQGNPHFRRSPPTRPRCSTRPSTRETRRRSRV